MALAHFVAHKKIGGVLHITGEILSYRLKTADILRGRVGDIPPLSVFCLLSFVFTYKGRKEKSEEAGENPAGDSYIYYMELLKEKKAEAGETAEGLRIRQKII